MTVVSYFRPKSVPEALDLLATHGPELLVIAGGTIAMPLINEGISLPSLVMGLRNMGLDTLERAGAELRIGSMLPVSRLTEQDDVPLLRDAARRTASWSIRNMATVGGNLFAPPPAGDVATALLALGAKVTAVGPAGTRELALDEFWTGFMTTALGRQELLTQIMVPITGDATRFIKFGRRQANTPAVVTVAVSAMLSGDIVSKCRIALGAVGPHPIRAHGAEAAVVGRRLDRESAAAAADAAAAECDPIADAIASDWYRRRMVRVFVERALIDLLDPTRSNGKEA